jgi:hypothetical protein
MKAKMKDMMESQIGFIVSRTEADRKTDWEEMEAALQSMWSELETIRQQVGKFMT